MAGVSDESSRIKDYKHKGFDLEKGRKKRLEEGIQLRKSKRDEQVCVAISSPLLSSPD